MNNIFVQTNYINKNTEYCDTEYYEENYLIYEYKMNTRDLCSTTHNNLEYWPQICAGSGTLRQKLIKYGFTPVHHTGMNSIIFTKIQNNETLFVKILKQNLNLYVAEKRFHFHCIRAFYTYISTTMKILKSKFDDDVYDCILDVISMDFCKNGSEYDSIILMKEAGYIQPIFENVKKHHIHDLAKSLSKTRLYSTDLFEDRFINNVNYGNLAFSFRHDRLYAKFLDIDDYSHFYWCDIPNDNKEAELVDDILSSIWIYIIHVCLNSLDTSEYTVSEIQKKKLRLHKYLKPVFHPSNLSSW
tara:strand:- start:303 stop:1202 length:900 start_codon:yes stop_codon:yes gene_type:complete